MVSAVKLIFVIIFFIVVVGCFGLITFLVVVVFVFELIATPVWFLALQHTHTHARTVATYGGVARVLEWARGKPMGGIRIGAHLTGGPASRWAATSNVEIG